MAVAGFLSHCLVLRSNGLLDRPIELFLVLEEVIFLLVNFVISFLVLYINILIMPSVTEYFNNIYIQTQWLFYTVICITCFLFLLIELVLVPASTPQLT